MPGYSNTLGIRMIEDLASSGKFIFNIDDAKYAGVRLGLSDSHVLALLSALTRSDWVTRLRRGLYAIGDGPMRGAAPHPFAIATRLIAPSAISHWSALQHHGLTTQVPRAVTAITTRKVVTPSMRQPGVENAGCHGWTVDGQRYEYVSVKQSDFFGIDNAWVDQRFRVPITDRERTVLDCFITPERFGGIGEGLAILDEYLGTLDMPKLVDYALRHGKGSVIKRLGWGLDRAGAPESTLAPLKNVSVNGYRPLDPGLPRRGPCRGPWGIQENLVVIGEID